MSIINRAYSSYLESKYQNEINEFKNLVLEDIEASLKYYKNRISFLVINEDDFEKESLLDVKKSYNEFFELKSKVENNILSLEYKDLKNLISLDVIQSYKKLEDIIVKGEKVSNG